MCKEINSLKLVQENTYKTCDKKIFYKYRKSPTAVEMVNKKFSISKSLLYEFHRQTNTKIFISLLQAHLYMGKAKSGKLNLN